MRIVEAPIDQNTTDVGEPDRAVDHADYLGRDSERPRGSAATTRRRAPAPAARTGLVAGFLAAALGLWLWVWCAHAGTNQPHEHWVAPGADVPLEFGAQGAPPEEGLQYAWALNGDYIPGATNALLWLRGVQPADSGWFTLTVFNAQGVVAKRKVRLQVDVPELPLADDFEAASLLASAAGTAAGTSVSATRQAGEPLLAGKQGARSVWVRWAPPISGLASLDTAGSDFDTLLAVYTGESLGGLTEVAGDDDSGGYHASHVWFNADAGSVYHVVVADAAKKGGRVVLRWRVEPGEDFVPQIASLPQSLAVLPGQPARLSVAYRSARPVAVQWYHGDREIAGANQADLLLAAVGESDLGFYTARLQVGTRSVLTPVAEVQISIGGTAPVLAWNKLSDVRAEKPAPRLNRSLAARRLRTARGLPDAALSGQARLATTVSSYSGTQVFTTSPGKDPEEPDHCGVVGGSSYWFEYVPPENGIARLDTAGSSYDTILAAYMDDGRGLGYESLVAVACDNNSGPNGLTSAMSFQATGSTSYFVVVDGVSAAYGTVHLNHSLNVPPTISQIADQTIYEDQATGNIAFTVADRETSAGSLAVSASSGDTNLAPVSNIVFGGSGGNRTVTVTPVALRCGTNTISIGVADAGGATALATFTLRVVHVNHSPVAGADSGRRFVGYSLQFYVPSLLQNDSDPDGDALTLTAVSSPSVHGATVSLNGSYVTYTPTANYNGADSFTYTISDGHGGSALGTVSVEMAPEG